MQAIERRGNLVRQSRYKLVAFFMLMLICGFALFWVKDLLLSVVVAVIISYLLAPWVDRAEGAGLSRLAASATVFFSFLTLNALFIWAVSPFLGRQLTSLRGDFPSYLASAEHIIQSFQDQAQDIVAGTFDITFGEGLKSFLNDTSVDALSIIPTLLSSSATVLILSPFIAFFLLRDGRDISRNILSIVPNSIFELSINLFHQINSQIGQYIRARLLESAIVGSIIIVGLLTIGIKYPFVLGVFAAVTNLIPYIGPLVGVVPALIVALTGEDPQFAFFLVLSVYTIAQLVDVFFIIPLVVAKIVNLHPVTVVIAVIVGAQLLGVLGMLISIPIFSAIKVTSTAIYNHVTDFG